MPINLFFGGVRFIKAASYLSSRRIPGFKSEVLVRSGNREDGIMNLLNFI